MEQIKFQSCLMKAENMTSNDYNKWKTANSIPDDNMESIDNTKEDIIAAKLEANRTNKLLFKNFDVINKEKLLEFGIIKKMNNRELYFYFLQYLANVIIVEENENIIKIILSKKKKNKKTKFIFDFSNGKINVTKTLETKAENIPMEEEEEEEFGKMIKIKNIDIEKYFPIKEKISINSLRNKIKEYSEELKYMDEYKNNFPDFESELFYHYQLGNVLSSFKELKDNKKFSQKIDMIKNINIFIQKVEENKIKDVLILRYFYFIIDVEYQLTTYIKYLLRDYNENIIPKYNDAYVKQNENKLIINDTAIEINNFDHYIITEDDVEEIKAGRLTLPLGKDYYSLKGYLPSRKFTKKEGNKFYETFISSKLLKNIIFILYGIDKDESFWRNIIQLFQKNTYYFPINNSQYAAYCDKKCFKIFIDHRVEKSDFLRKLDEKLIFLIKKAFFTLNSEHEFGHGHLPLFFYLYPNSFSFDSPLVEMKLNANKIIQTKEGGKFFEYLLYGRIIYEMNLKEIIYICNTKNFSKDLETFRRDFLNLKNEDVVTVFQRETGEDIEIMGAFEAYKKLPQDLKKQLETEIFKSGKVNPQTNFNIDTYKFKSGKERKCPIEERRKLSED